MNSPTFPPPNDNDWNIPNVCLPPSHSAGFSTDGMERSCYTAVGEHERPESSDQGKPLASFPMSLGMRHHLGTVVQLAFPTDGDGRVYIATGQVYIVH